MYLFSLELFFFFYIIFIYLPFLKKTFEPQILIWYNRKPPRLPRCHCRWKPPQAYNWFSAAYTMAQERAQLLQILFYFSFYKKNFFLATQLLFSLLFFFTIVLTQVTQQIKNQRLLFFHNNKIGNDSEENNVNFPLLNKTQNLR